MVVFHLIGFQITNYIQEILIALAFIGLLILGIYLIKRMRHKKPKQVSEVFEESQLPILMNALGEKDNLSSVSLEHQRLKVIVKDIKKVSSQTLQTLKIPVFLKGKELTLLIKHQHQAVFQYLKKEIGA